MNKICVVAKNKDTYFVKRLIEEVGDEVVLFDPWSDFHFPSAEKYLVRSSGIYGNDLDLMFLKSVSPEKVTNPLPVLQRFRTKSSQYDWFEEREIPSLPWIHVKGTDLITIEKFFRLYPELIVKPLRGQGGWGIEALTWDLFKKWKKKKGSDEEYLLQPFIKNAVEYRYFFLKDSRPVVLERKSKSGIAANFQRQGEAKIANLPEEFQKIVDDLIAKSGAVYGAIDMLVQDGRLFILELNAVPGIEQAEKVSGRNLMQDILKVLQSEQ
jgi:glutathione synthase/RimK-type ligase-like ATP-grasp enzyme